MDTDSLRKSGEDAESIFKSISTAAEAAGANIGRIFTEVAKKTDAIVPVNNIAALLGNKGISQLAKEYATSAQQRLAIEKKFQAEIAKLRQQAAEAATEEEANRLNAAADEAAKKKRQEQASSEFETLKKKVDWDAMSADMSKPSMALISYVLEQMQQLLNLNKGNMSDDGIQGVTKDIEKLQGELGKRDPFIGLDLSNEAVFTAKNELVAALNEYKTARGELKTAEDEYNAALAQQQALEAQIAEGTLAGDSEAYAAAKKKVADAAAAQAKAQQQCVNIETKAFVANSNLSGAYATYMSRLGAVRKVMSELGTDAKNLAAVFNADVAAGIGNALGFMDDVFNATKSIVDEVGKTSKVAARTIESTTKAAADGMSTTTEAAAATMGTVEKASVILAVISAALQIATSIAKLFNQDAAKQETIDALQGRIDQLQWEQNNASAVRLHENSFDAIAKVKEVYAQAEAAVYAYYGATDDANGRFLVTLLKGNTMVKTAAATLAQAYANVSYTADKALGTDKFDKAKDEMQNIAEQNILLQQQIDTEKSKKKTDDTQVAQWERQIQENGQKMASVINGFMEEIIGGSAVNIASQLGDALMSAFQNGENAADAWGKKVDDIVKDIIKQMLIANLIEKPIGDIFNKYKEKWFKDGSFVGADNLMGSMDEFSNDLNAVGGKVIEVINTLPDDVKKYVVGEGGAADRTVDKGGLTAASQDSVDYTNGQLTLGNATLTNIREDVHSMRSVMAEMYGNGAAILGEVQGIRLNTAVLPLMREDMNQMKEYMRNIRESSENLNRGVRIR